MLLMPPVQVFLSWPWRWWKTGTGGICVQSNGGDGDDCCRYIIVGMILSFCYLVWSYCPLIIGVTINITIIMVPITHTPFFDGQ
jgi:hypothetical protein